MSGTIVSPPAAESPKDFGTDAGGKAVRWRAELDHAMKEQELWEKQAKGVIERYRDEGPGRQTLGSETRLSMRFNILWSNIQTLQPALYALEPNVVVERRWGADEDDTSRVAAMILQRTAEYQLKAADFHSKMQQTVLDHLLTGRGTVWIRYMPHFTSQPVLVQAPPQAEPMPSGTPGPPGPLGPPGPPGGPPGGLPGGAPAAYGAGITPQPPSIPTPSSAGGGPVPPAAAAGGAAGPMQPPENGAGAAGPPAAPSPPPPDLAALGMPMAPPHMVEMPGIPPGGIPIGNMMHDEQLAGGKRTPDGGVQVSDDGEQDAEFLAFESVEIDHVHWLDWFCSPARTWAEVRWVARRVYMTRDELAARFGKKLADEVPLDWLPKTMQEENNVMQPEHQIFRRAQVFEIWDRPSRRCYWLAYEYLDKLLDEREDPLRLPDFFPTPKPLYGTLTTDSLIPVPDYRLYRDQAMQIDSLTARIEAISKAIKVCGVYDAAQEGIQRMFAEGVENQLIPVNQWMAFGEAGGLKGSMDLLDISMLSEVLERLVAIRAQAKDDLYEVTGISDIIRGTSVASETATAQQIKAGFGTMRLRARQADVARFCRDVIRLVSEVICEHFQPRTMLLVSDIGNFGAGQDVLIAPGAIAMLKDDKTRPLRIDIEADSTIMANQQQEQQSRVQFLQMAGQFLQQAIPAVQQTPQLAPLLGQMLLFGIRAFPQGAELEGAFEQAVRQMEQFAKTNPGPPPNPQEGVAQAQIANYQSQIQDRQVRAAAEARELEAKTRLEMAKLGIQGRREDDAAANETIRAFHDRDASHQDAMIELAKLRQQAMQPKAA